MADGNGDRQAHAVIAVVGAGPRGVSFLERLSANIDLLPDTRIDVHLIDPFPPGPGRVWRHEQSPLLRMNSMAEDVTMFTDDSVRCEGPIVPGPSLAQWAEQERGRGADDPELAALTGRSFASRRMASRYLAWFFDHVREALPDTVRVVVHTDTVTRITGPADGRQSVWLAGADRPLVADTVVLAIGHTDEETHGAEQELADFALRHDLYYLPPAYTADVDLDDIPAGEPLLVRGLGLVFVDLMVLLTEGRGGRYTTAPDGTLTYLPSGREPLLYAGSRRGVPYHAKIGYGLTGDRPPLPRFFGPDAVRELAAAHDRLDFREHVWPLVAKEIGWGYYAKLDRLALPWPEFAARYAALDWSCDDMRALIAEAVPDPADRLDLETLDHPIRGLWFADPERLQDHLREYVRADLVRRNDPAHGADLGAFLALLSCYAQLPALIASSRLDPDSRRDDLDSWWVGFFSFYASGPPGDRLEQLLALSRAGLLRFLGADMWVRADEDTGVFTAGSASTDEVVTARALAEARQPKPTVAHTANDLLAYLRDAGVGTEELLSDGTGSGLILASGVDSRLLDEGAAHRRRFALGPFTTVRTAAAFSRPHTNAPSFRYGDAAARAVLRLLDDVVRTGEVSTKHESFL